MSHKRIDKWKKASRERLLEMKMSNKKEKMKSGGKKIESLEKER
jgi:hypothetical protein